MNRTLAIALLSIALTGCAATLSPEAQAVRLYNREPKSCTQLGAVDATGLKAGGNSNYAQVDRLRDQTVSLGGNTLYIHTVSGEGFKRGTAYKCS